MTAEQPVSPQQTQPQAGTAQGGGWLRSLLYFAGPMLLYVLIERLMSGILGGGAQAPQEMPVQLPPEMEPSQRTYAPEHRELVTALMRPAEESRPLFGNLYGRLYNQRTEI